MDFSWKNVEYRVKQVGETHMLWLKILNRYLELEEPALLVFQLLANGQAIKEIVKDCALRYSLPEQEAGCFVSEIKDKFESLYHDHQEPEDPLLSSTTDIPPFNFHIERSIEVAGKCICFTFGDSIMEQSIFPYFAYLESSKGRCTCDLHIELQSHLGKVYMRVNQDQLYAWPREQSHKLKGALFLQMMNAVHDELNGEWMGVIHAASISLGERALMFPAQSGGGKSTLASMLMAHGCELLSDDFTPIALKSGRIHTFPGSISIKSGSWPLLETFFPELLESQLSTSPSKGESIKFLRPRQPEYQANGGFSVRAIVFVQYDRQKECDLHRISNQAAINDFLKESWLPDDVLVAEQFLNWFFDIPCYSLHYGDNLKAIDSILTLLKDVT